MKLRPIIFIFAALSFLGALLVWRSEPPSASEVFTSREVKALSGMAAPYSTPKGVTRVRIQTNKGAIYFTDCLALLEVCSGEKGAQRPIDVHAVLLTQQEIWPITASVNGREIVNSASSKNSYDLFVEREGELYRLPLLLGVVLVIFAYWFGNRSALP